MKLPAPASRLLLTELLPGCKRCNQLCKLKYNPNSPSWGERGLQREGRPAALQNALRKRTAYTRGPLPALVRPSDKRRLSSFYRLTALKQGLCLPVAQACRCLPKAAPATLQCLALK